MEQNTETNLLLQGFSVPPEPVGRESPPSNGSESAFPTDRHQASGQNQTRQTPGPNQPHRRKSTIGEQLRDFLHLGKPKGTEAPRSEVNLSQNLEVSDDGNSRRPSIETLIQKEIVSSALGTPPNSRPQATTLPPVPPPQAENRTPNRNKRRRKKSLTPPPDSDWRETLAQAAREGKEKIAEMNNRRTLLMEHLERSKGRCSKEQRNDVDGVMSELLATIDTLCQALLSACEIRSNQPTLRDIDMDSVYTESDTESIFSEAPTSKNITTRSRLKSSPAKLQQNVLPVIDISPSAPPNRGAAIAETITNAVRGETEKLKQEILKEIVAEIKKILPATLAPPAPQPSVNATSSTTCPNKETIQPLTLVNPTGEGTSQGHQVPPPDPKRKDATYQKNFPPLKRPVHKQVRRVRNEAGASTDTEDDAPSSPTWVQVRSRKSKQATRKRTQSTNSRTSATSRRESAAEPPRDRQGTIGSPSTNSNNNGNSRGTNINQRDIPSTQPANKRKSKRGRGKKSQSAQTARPAKETDPSTDVLVTLKAPLPNATAEETLTALRREINPVREKIEFISIARAKQRDVRVTCATGADALRLQAAINRSRSLVGRIQPKALPRIALRGVPADMSDQALMSDVSLLLKELMVPPPKILFRLGARGSRTETRVIEVNPEQRVRLLEGGGRIRCGWTTVRASDHTSMPQCHRCQLLGHTQEKCVRAAGQDICRYCADNHASRDCPTKEDPSTYKCHGCAKNKLKGPPHMSGDSNRCSYIRQKRTMTRKMVQYTTLPPGIRAICAPPSPGTSVAHASSAPIVTTSSSTTTPPTEPVLTTNGPQTQMEVDPSSPPPNTGSQPKRR